MPRIGAAFGGKTIKRSLVGVFVVVLLFLVLMPVLLYLMGWAVTRYTSKAPSWIGFPERGKEPGSKSGRETPPKAERCRLRT